MRNEANKNKRSETERNEAIDNLRIWLNRTITIRSEAKEAEPSGANFCERSEVKSEGEEELRRGG